MTDNLSIFESEYIIDGKLCEITPGQMLRECMPCPSGAAGDNKEKGRIMDETVDRGPTSFQYDARRIGEYSRMTAAASSSGRNFMTGYPAAFTRQRIAAALIDAIWMEGHFRLENLRIEALWEWNPAPIGNMAALYSSAQAASEYIYDIGTGLSGYSYRKTDGACRVAFSISGAVPQGDDDNTAPHISGSRICPDRLVQDKSGWLIYVPFDPCAFRLGGSLLAEASGHNGGPAPEIRDPDYFIDCYEVIRELVEDGVIIAGETVGDGGLLTAAHRMCRETGMQMNISGIESAYQENDPVRILFSEIPGVLIQIADSDYDYIDAQMLLQDIAYYPLGHPSGNAEGVEVLHGGKPGVAGILEALMQGQSSEGED